MDACGGWCKLLAKQFTVLIIIFILKYQGSQL